MKFSQVPRRENGLMSIKQVSATPTFLEALFLGKKKWKSIVKRLKRRRDGKHGSEVTKV